jgi:hypothetical protein
VPGGGLFINDKVDVRLDAVRLGVDLKLTQ